MAKLLSKEELASHLKHFRNILAHFDYSSLQNIRFLSLEAFYNYMDSVEGNPFQKQYQALQKELDFLQPYLPFVSASRASEFLIAMSHTDNESESLEVKKDFTQKLRQDFITAARTYTTDCQWQSILDVCEEIRKHKEEMSFALY